MKKLLYLGLIAAFVLLEPTFLNYFRVFLVKPNLSLTAVFMACIFFNPAWALAFAVFAGILRDSLGISAYGVNTVLFPLWAFLILRLFKKISAENNIVRIAVLSIILVLNSIITKALIQHWGGVVSPWVFIKITTLETLYTVLVFHWLFSLLHPVFANGSLAD